MHPARDEGLRPQAAAQQVLPHRERAGDAEQRFAGDEGDRREVQVAKPGISHPAPAERCTDPHENQAADDEGGDQEVSY